MLNVGAWCTHIVVDNCDRFLFATQFFFIKKKTPLLHRLWCLILTKFNKRGLNRDVKMECVLKHYQVYLLQVSVLTGQFKFKTLLEGDPWVALAQVSN